MRISDWSSDVCSSDLKKRTLLTLTSIVAVMAFALSAFVYEQSQLRKNKTADTPASELVRMHSPVFGAASAKVTIVEFFDPSCETCRSEEHTSELQSLMRISYAVFCLKNKTKQNKTM